MVYPVASGHPDYSGLLIPQVWSPRILEKFYEFSVLESIANTNYEGEITAYGDKVIIRMRPDIIIRDYVKGQPLQTQRPDQPVTNLQIDRGHYWNILIEDVDAAQADIDYMEEWTEGAAEQLNERINEVVLGEIYTDSAPENSGATAGRKSGYWDLGATGSPRSITKANVVDVLGECAATLTEYKIPERDRWMVIPAWMKQQVYASDSRSDLIKGGDQDMLRKGHIGSIAGFDLYLSNQLTDVADGSDLATNVVFGHKSALTFASQLTNSDVLKTESAFGRLARGLSVYGFNVVKPDAMGTLYCTKG